MAGRVFLRAIVRFPCLDNHRSKAYNKAALQEIIDKREDKA